MPYSTDDVLPHDNINPLVSIILPFYNQELYLERAICSVLAQSYDNWELKLINDGSEDNSLEIAQSFRDPRIVIQTQKNLGVSAARNNGLRLMRGSLFTFLDADDLLPENSLDVRVERMLERPDIDILAGKVAQVSELGQPTGLIWSPKFEGDPLRGFVRLDQRIFYGIPLFIRRHHSIVYRFAEGMTHAEDLLFYLNMAAQSHLRYSSLDGPIVYLHRKVDSSAMSSLSGLEEGYRLYFNAVCKLQDSRLTIWDRVYLKYRYVRIMFLSYLRIREYKKAAGILRDLTHWSPHGPLISR